MVHQGNELTRALLVERGEFVDISATDKSALASAGHDHEPQSGIVAQRRHRIDDLDHQRAVERIQLRGIVDRQADDVAAFGSVVTGNHHAHRALLRLEPEAPVVHSRRGLAEEASVDIVEDIDEIREIYGEPMERTIKKQLPLLEPLAVNGKVPRSGILITAEEVYFHCGKALIRSDLWNPEKHLARGEWPSLGRIIAEQIGTDPVEGERMTAESYRTRLY